MSISSRIHDTLESWSAEWKDRLRGWMASWVMKGMETLMDAFEPDLRAEVKTSMDRLKTIPGLPDDIRDILDKATGESSFIQVAAILPYLVGILIGLGMGAAAPMSRYGSYQLDQFIHSFRLDPLSIITAWRRDPDKYAWLFGDLDDQGWNEERQEALKFFTEFIPTADEQTTWLAREVYEPEMVSKYGLDDELPVYEETDFAKVGVTPEQMINKWRAHWMHATWIQMVEMLHRGLVTEDDVWEWFRLVEIVPFWRDKMIQTAYTWPTRVDVRRFYDLQTIDEARLREIYMGMGYRDQNLEDYILWTKIYVRLPDLIARWKNGWITLDKVKESLVGYGMKPEAAQELIETKVKVTEPTETTEVKKLTVAQIIRWVKLDEAARRPLGVELLQDLEYTNAQAEFIMEGYLGEIGSPETFEDFKDLTQKYRRAVGLEAKPMSEELKAAAEEVVRLTNEIEALKKSIEEEEAKLIEEEVLPEAATARRDELRVSLHRAEAELARAQTEYNRLLAEWRHGE